MENVENTKVKAKRKINALDFTGANAAVALVSKDQGGPANGVTTLLIKASNFSDDFIKKASQITVTMEITEYLRRFFHIYDVDAEILARSLGFTTAAQDKAAIEQKEDLLEDNSPPEYPDWETEPGDKKFERYIDYKVTSIQVMKKLHTAESLTEALSSLTEEEYLQFLKDQSLLEKAFAKIEKESPEVVKTTKADVNTSITQREVEEGKGNSPVVKTTNKEKRMTKAGKVTVVEQTMDVEMIEKAQFESIQKQFAETQEMLQKALATVAQFEQEKKELIAKQRLANLEAVVAKEHADVIFKAVKDTADEDFQAVVKALGTISVAVAQSDLFVEKGVVVEDKPVENESVVARLIKAKLQAKQ